MIRRRFIRRSPAAFAIALGAVLGIGLSACTKKDSLVLLDLRASGPLGARVVRIRLSAKGWQTKTLDGTIDTAGFRVGYYGPGDGKAVSVLAEAIDAADCVLGSGEATVSALEAGATSAPTTLFVRPRPENGCVVDAGTPSSDGSTDDAPSADASPEEDAAADAGTDAGGDAAADASDDTASPSADASTTDASATDASATDASSTDASATDASTTSATDASTTDASSTSATDASSTDASATDASTTSATDASTTDASSTSAPLATMERTSSDISLKRRLHPRSLPRFR